MNPFFSSSLQKRNNKQNQSQISDLRIERKTREINDTDSENPIEQTDPILKTRIDNSAMTNWTNIIDRKH